MRHRGVASLLRCVARDSVEVTDTLSVPDVRRMRPNSDSRAAKAFYRASLAQATFGSSSQGSGEGSVAVAMPVLRLFVTCQPPPSWNM